MGLPAHTTGSLNDFAGFDKLKHFSANGAKDLEGTHQVTWPPGLGQWLCLYECKAVSRVYGGGHVHLQVFSQRQDSTGVMVFCDVMVDTAPH